MKPRNMRLHGAVLGAATILALGTAFASADVLFTDQFTGSEIDANSWFLSDRSFEYMNSQPTGTMNYYIDGGIVNMSYTPDSSYWPGVAFVTQAGYAVSPENPVTFQIDRHYNTYNQASGSRCAVLIYNSDLSKWVHFAETTDGSSASSAKYYGWCYNRYIGQSGDKYNGVGVGMDEINLNENLTDHGLHTIKLVATGETVTFFIDDVEGATVDFPFTDGVRFGFGVYARAADDYIEDAFGNVIITGTGNMIAFDKSEYTLTGDEGTISVKGQLISTSQDVTLTLTSQDPSIAAFPTGDSYDVVMKAGKTETYTIPVVKKGVGKVIFTASNNKGVVMNPAKLTITAQGNGETVLFDDFDGAEVDSNLWTVSTRSFEYWGSSPTAESTITQADSSLTINVSPNGHYWPGAALVSKGTFNASSLSPLTFEVTRESFNADNSTGGRCGIYLYNEDMSEYVLLDDTSDGGSVEGCTYYGWCYSYLANGDTSRRGGTTKLPNAGDFADKGNHTLKIVANGLTASLYVDGVFGIEVPFKCYTGIRCSLAVFGRYEGDLVTGQFGSAKVTASTEPLADPVNITRQPKSFYGYAVEGKTYTMDVEVSGTPEISYQWYKDNTAIEGATQSSLTIDCAYENEGEYTVEVSNEMGTAVSDPASVGFISVEEGSYAAAVLAQDPLAYWRFDESEGTTAYDYAGGFNGTYNSNQTLGAAGALQGDSDTAVTFGGSSYVAVSGMNFSSSAVTMLAWIKPDGAINNFTGIMFDRGNSAAGIDIADNQLCYHWNDTRYSYRSGLQVKQGEWNLVAMVVTSSGATFYLGDAQGNFASATDGTSQSAATFTSSFTIGGDKSNSDRRFKGVIDEPAFFNRALTEDDIFSIYNAGLYGKNSPVAIKVQPQSYAGFVGDSVTLSVTAVGSSPFNYEWQREIDGEWVSLEVAGSGFTFVGTAEDSGNYRVIVSNNINSVTSETAVVDLAYKPTSVDLTGEEYKLWTHLKFDNDYQDSSSNGNNAYDASYGEMQFVEGVLGAAIDVKSAKDGSIVNQYASFENPLFLGSEPITVAFWTKFITEEPNDLPWLCNSEGSFGNQGFTLAPGYTGAGTGYAPNGWSWSIRSWDVSDSGINKYGPDNTMPAGKWHHLVFVMDPGKTMKVFLNGELVSTTDISSIAVSDMWLDNQQYLMNIGQDGTGSYDESVEMLMDDMGIWRTALSDVDARSIYYAGINGNSFDQKLPDVKPGFIVEPVGATVYQNDTTVLTLSVEVNGTEPITVTWTKDGEKVGRGRTLVVACTEDAAGSYQATAKNAAGEATSAVAVIAYREPETAYEGLVANLNPVAFYRFDDNIADGIAVDYVAARNGVYHNVAAAQQVNGAILEDPSKSIEFKGAETSSYVSTPIQLNDMIANGAMSFMGWIKITSYLEFASLYGQNDLIEFGHDSATSIRAWSSGPGNISGAAPADGQWAMVTVTYSNVDGQIVESLYINDVLASQYNGTTPINSASGTSYYFNIAAGVWNATGNYFNGCIDDVAIFPTTPSAENISYLYNVGKFGPGAAPTVETQPVGAEIYANDGTFTLSLKPAGTPPLTVKWYLNGNETAYEGESVQIARTTANAGSWTAVVSNAYGKAESEPAVISFYQPKSDYEALVASLMPVAYWRLGEAEGTTAAEYASGFLGTYNQAQTLGAAGAIANDSDTAVTFDGTSYVSVPGMSFSSENITMLTWIKRNGSINNYSGVLFDRGNSAAGIDLVNNKVAYHWNDQYWSYDSGLVTEDGVWNFVALVVTPTEATFYLGDSEGNLSSAVNAQAHSKAKLTGSFTIGGDANWSDRRFKGEIDEPAVFGYALSADQIESIYKKGMGGDTPTGPALSFEMTDLGLILTWETGKLQTAPTAEGPWSTIEDASNEGYIYNGESGNLYFRLAE